MPEGLDRDWVSTPVGRHLAGRPKIGTHPEMLLRHGLHAAGFRYRVSFQISPGCRPDITFTRRRLAVFVDGCFWHACPLHGRRSFRGPNEPLWKAKLIRNKRNDIRANTLAVEAGYRVLRVWECSITRSLGPTLKALARELDAGERDNPRVIQMAPGGIANLG